MGKSLACGSSARRWRSRDSNPGRAWPPHPAFSVAPSAVRRTQRCPGSPEPRGPLTASSRRLLVMWQPISFITRTRGPENRERNYAEVTPELATEPAPQPAGSPVSWPIALSTPGQPARAFFFRTAFPKSQALALHLYVRGPSVLLFILPNVNFFPLNWLFPPHPPSYIYLFRVETYVTTV